MGQEEIDQPRKKEQGCTKEGMEGQARPKGLNKDNSIKILSSAVTCFFVSLPLLVIFVCIRGIMSTLKNRPHRLLKQWITKTVLSCFKEGKAPPQTPIVQIMKVNEMLRQH
jgi:hypothetical protein